MIINLWNVKLVSLFFTPVDDLAISDDKVARVAQVRRGENSRFLLERQDAYCRGANDLEVFLFVEQQKLKDKCAFYSLPQKVIEYFLRISRIIRIL